MRRLIEFVRTLELPVLAVVLLSSSAIAIGQQQPPTVTHPSTSNVQVSPQRGPSPYGSAANTATRMKLPSGTITGFVYWQMNVFQPQADCQGLTVKAITVSKVGMPLQLLSTANTLTAAGPMTDTSSPGTPKYMLCSYAFQNMPENVALRVLLYGAPSSTSVSMPSSFQIPGGNCNSTPSSSLSFILTGGEMLCGNGAFNVNFKVTSAAVAARPTTSSILLPHTPGPSGMLSQPQAAPANATPGAPKTGGATLLSANPSSAPGNASNTPASNGMPAPTVKSGGASSISGSGGFTGGVKPGTAPPRNPLTNADVIRMQKAGISESVIVHSIQSSTKQFDFSSTSLQALRQAHVSPKVLAAMCDGSAPACPQTVGTTETATPASKVELNPHPFPPPTAANAAGATPGANVSLNPQTLLPGANHANAQIVNIAQVHSNLCAIAGCLFAPPTLQSLDSASVVSPGGKVVLQGVHFNSSDGNPGQIVLKMGNKFPMAVIHLGNPVPRVYQQPYVERQLTVLGWADGHVFGQIPADISGVIDGPATFEIWRSDGSKSSPLAVHFTAARDLEILPLADMTLVSCQATADSNLCNQWSDSSQLSIPSNIPFFKSFSIFGEHTMFIPDKTQYQVYGIDKYSFNLKNGWAAEPYEMNEWSNHACSSDGLPHANYLNSKPDSSTPSSSDVHISWSAGCDAQYSIALHITGPQGVPWK